MKTSFTNIVSSLHSQGFKKMQAKIKRRASLFISLVKKIISASWHLKVRISFNIKQTYRQPALLKIGSTAFTAHVRLSLCSSNKASADSCSHFQLETQRCFEALFSKVWKHLEIGRLRILQRYLLASETNQLRGFPWPSQPVCIFTWVSRTWREPGMCCKRI